MRFRDIRKTIVKSGDPFVDREAAVGMLLGDLDAGVAIPATPRWVALKPTSPERFRPQHNRASRRKLPVVIRG